MSRSLRFSRWVTAGLTLTLVRPHSESMNWTLGAVVLQTVPRQLLLSANTGFCDTNCTWTPLMHISPCFPFSWNSRGTFWWNSLHPAHGQCRSPGCPAKPWGSGTRKPRVLAFSELCVCSVRSSWEQTKTDLHFVVQFFFLLRKCNSLYTCIHAVASVVSNSLQPHGL